MWFFRPLTHQVYREQGVKVEISHDGEWLTGTTLELLEVGAATSDLRSRRGLSEKNWSPKTGWLMFGIWNPNFAQDPKFGKMDRFQTDPDSTKWILQDMPSRLKVLVEASWDSEWQRDANFPDLT